MHLNTSKFNWWRTTEEAMRRHDTTRHEAYPIEEIRDW